ncbi:TMEM165/GDT1 family protein [Haloechinothrix salitolerans]|uniref:GDT1 family protein n=1 Tax=Haloechinothrix salitolerans TaxID=926830 RepID=A0ABW2BS02_9PSEU
MTAELLAFVSAFALVFAVELPDKTMVATLVLTTRYQGLPVFTGVSVAFMVHVTVAALFGGALRLLPGALVTGVVALLFGIGAYLLLREGFAPVRDGAEDASRQGAGPVSFTRAALTSFGVLFAAELGDASQLATVGLAARWGEPLAVGLGSFAALAAVAGVAVLVGHKVRARIDPRLLHRVSGIAFAVFAVAAAVRTFA